MRKSNPSVQSGPNRGHGTRLTKSRRDCIPTEKLGPALALPCQIVVKVVLSYHAVYVSEEV